MTHLTTLAELKRHITLLLSNRLTAIFPFFADLLQPTLLTSSEPREARQYMRFAAIPCNHVTEPFAIGPNGKLVGVPVIREPVPGEHRLHGGNKVAAAKTAAAGGIRQGMNASKEPKPSRIILYSRIF